MSSDILFFYPNLNGVRRMVYSGTIIRNSMVPKLDLQNGGIRRLNYLGSLLIRILQEETSIAGAMISFWELQISYLT